jgi:hypothetical protein
MIREVCIMRVKLVLAAVVLSMCFAGSAIARTEQCPAAGENKVDAPGGSTFTCPEGVVTGICVKAGTKAFGVGAGGDDPGPDDCYIYGGEDSPTGTTGRIGSGRDCKGISHSSFYCGEGPTPSPSPSPSPTPPPPPTPTPTPSP